MCFRTRVTVPDTSAAQAEAARQMEVLLAQAEARRVEELRLAEERRTGDTARYDQQLADLRAENTRQREADLAAAAQERADRLAAAEQDELEWNTLLTELRSQAEARSGADRAYAEQQIAALQAEATARQAEQTRQYEELLAKQEAERAAQEQATQERSTRIKDYNTGRQGLVDAFTQQVNDSYSGFDDAFYEKYMKDQVEAANPALDRAYENERNSLIYAFADAGALDSRAANKRFADVDRVRETRRSQVAQNAFGSAQDFRDDIDQQRRDALTTAFTSGAVGREDLPDGVTDVSGELSRVEGSLGSLVGDVRNRAASARPNSAASVTALLDDTAINTTGPRSTLQTFGRWGGNSAVNTSGVGRTSYTVR